MFLSLLGVACDTAAQDTVDRPTCVPEPVKERRLLMQCRNVPVSDENGLTYGH